MIKVEDIFTGSAALLLLPMEKLFNFGMFDDW
jgi:hypothetical protein